MATATQNGHRTNGHVVVDEPDNPLHRLTPEQIEEIGREFDAAPRAGQGRPRRPRRDATSAR